MTGLAEMVSPRLAGAGHDRAPATPASSRKSTTTAVAHTKLLDLGLQPHLLNDEHVASLVELAIKHKSRVNPEAIRPTVFWRTTKSEVNVSGGAVGE